MAKRRWLFPFRFRLPWFSAPADPHPGHASQAPSQPAPAQRPPFHPAQVAPAQLPPRSQSPEKAQPQLSSQTRAISQPPAQSQGSKQSRAPPASLSSAAPQAQISPKPASPLKQVDTQSQPASQSPRLKFPAAPPPTPSKATAKKQPEAKPPSPPKEPSTTVEVSQPQKRPMNQETLQSTPHSQKPKPSEVTIASQEKGIESSSGEKQEQPNAFAKYSLGVSNPKAEVDPTPLEKHTWMRRGMNYNEPKDKKVTNKQVSALKEEPEEHPIGLLDERGQHPNEEVFDVRKPFQTFRDRDGHEKLGDNTGATMQQSSESSNRKKSIQIHRGNKINPYESIGTATGEGSSGVRIFSDSKLHKQLAKKFYVNNNAQGINNSLAFNSSLTERNPGVHVVLTCDPEENIKPQKERETVQTQEAEVAFNPAERLYYAPTITRYLTGLSSWS